MSSTYSYLLASRHGGEALIIDPVLEKVDRYLELLGNSTSGWSRRWIHICTQTTSPAWEPSGPHALHHGDGRAEQGRCRVHRVADGDRLKIEGIGLEVMYTPGHTDDSYSFLFGDRVFTGDTLLIRGTGGPTSRMVILVCSMNRCSAVC